MRAFHIEIILFYEIFYEAKDKKKNSKSGMTKMIFSLSPGAKFSISALQLNLENCLKKTNWIFYRGEEQEKI